MADTKQITQFFKPKSKTVAADTKHKHEKQMDFSSKTKKVDVMVNEDDKFEKMSAEQIENILREFDYDVKYGPYTGNLFA